MTSGTMEGLRVAWGEAYNLADGTLVYTGTITNTGEYHRAENLSVKFQMRDQGRFAADAFSSPAATTLSPGAVTTFELRVPPGSGARPTGHYEFLGQWLDEPKEEAHVDAGTDLYEVLQVSPSAKQEVIEAAFRRLARMYHPDVNPSPNATREMAHLNAAYAVLSNREQRAAYDARREAERPLRADDQAFRAEASSVKPVTKVAWWRWLLIPPAAVLGWVIAQILVLLVAIILPDRVSQLVSSFIPPMGFVILGTWAVPVKRTQVAGALAVILLVVHGMLLGVILVSGRYESSEVVFNSIAMVLGIIGSLLGFYIAKMPNIRKGVGLALVAFLGVSQPIVGVAIFLGIVAGVWWPIGKTIIESPLWALLLIPAGLFFSAVAWWIQTFIYGLLVWPVVWLTKRLLEEKK